MGRWFASLAPLALLSGCPGDEAPPSAGTGATGSGGAAGSSGAAGAAGAAWDPVWHETEAKDWPTVGPENNPDCGPGCRVALNVPMTNHAGSGHLSHGDRILSVSEPGLAMTEVGSSQTLIAPHPPTSTSAASASTRWARARRRIDG